MRRTAILSLILGFLIVGISASLQARTLEPNIGFCNPPVSATACSGQPETNQVPSGAAIGMWSSGSNDASGPWCLILAIPDGTYTSSTMPALTSASSNSGSAPSASLLTTWPDAPENFTSDKPSQVRIDFVDDWYDQPRHEDWCHRPRHQRPPDCNPVPEPASIIMMSSGLMLLAGVLRRRFRG